MKQIHAKCSGPPETFGSVFSALAREPYDLLVRRWNWKSALFSSVSRGAMFLLVNLSAGWEAASGAMLAEFAYRASTAGFSGALTQAFRLAEPRWAAALAIPLASHALEFMIHWLRGTPNLRLSILASLAFTIFSTLFNLHAMSRGVLVVGRDSRPLLADLRALPTEILTFMNSGLGLFPISTGRREWF